MQDLTDTVAWLPSEMSGIGQGASLGRAVRYQGGGPRWQVSTGNSSHNQATGSPTGDQKAKNERQSIKCRGAALETVNLTKVCEKCTKRCSSVVTSLHSTKHSAQTETCQSCCGNKKTAIKQIAAMQQQEKPGGCLQEGALEPTNHRASQMTRESSSYRCVVANPSPHTHRRKIGQNNREKPLHDAKDNRR
jgi:hypothetical protein